VSYLNPKLSLFSSEILSITLINNKIPDNMYLVLGNKIREEDSFDSRYFGYISKEQIIGKVVKISK